MDIYSFISIKMWPVKLTQARQPEQVTTLVYTETTGSHLTLQLPVVMCASAA
jgi:hypothetical protein